MQTFFHGWRRKAGFVTLVMACAFLCGRVRSETYSDSFLFSYGTNTNGSIDSENGYLIFESTTMLSEVSHRTDFRTLLCCDPNECYLYYRDEKIGWRFQCFTVGVYEVIPDNSGGPFSLFTATRTWFMSYWTIISPLTLLSAYLILWKPRKRA